MTPRMTSVILPTPAVPGTLDEVPSIDVEWLNGQSGEVWHDNEEARKLRRVMTEEELEDQAGYDRSLYRAREKSLKRLRAKYGEVWMLVPKRENRGRQWLPERIYKGVAA